MLSAPAISNGLSVASTIATLFFVFASLVAHYGQQTYPKSSLRKSLLRIFALLLIVSSYVAQIALVIRFNKSSNARLDTIIALIYSALAWSFILLRGRLLASETAGLSIITIVFHGPSLVLAVATPEEQPYRLASLGLQGLRVLLAVVLLADASSSILRRSRKVVPGEEASPLLSESHSDISTGDTLYGAASPTTDCSSFVDDTSEPSTTFDDEDDDDEEDDGGDSRTSQLRKSGSWITYVQNFRIFLPYLIPKKDYKVQGCLVLCVLALAAGRVLTVLVPRQLGIVADQLIAGQLPYQALAIHYVLSLLHGETGVDLVVAICKIPIQQFSYRQLTNAAFSHVMGLSMEFHSDRDSAETMKAIEQGEALTNILDTAILEILPTVVDMLTAFILLYTKFTFSVAICMMTASVLFLGTEVVTSSWNINNRRKVTKTERAETRIMHQAVQSWRTVSAFNMFSYEKFRFGSAVGKHLGAKRDWSAREAYIDAGLQALCPTAFFALALLVMNQVYSGRASPGDFVFLMQYWEFLIWPLRYLSHEYRYLMKDLVDAERLLDLLTTEASIRDTPDATALGDVEGRVEFDSVGFKYDAKRTALHDVDITANPGETVALVGSTGAGKSTIMKLLMRYYDVTSGSIKVDGVDIRSITQGSLRDVLGLVPQDPLLFNASIMDNLRYAKLSATDEEVHDACRAAAIHDKILTFSNSYSTKVGEQGVKLSGGELQRLAIARVFLKNPPILIFDEATSAVDTETEAAIQEALRKVTHKRTTFIIAHRLSTIVRADQILVLQDGSVIERGSHQNLLEKRGKYFNLWQKQLGSSSGGEELGTLEL